MINEGKTGLAGGLAWEWRAFSPEVTARINKVLGDPAQHIDGDLAAARHIPRDGTGKYPHGFERWPRERCDAWWCGIEDSGSTARGTSKISALEFTRPPWVAIGYPILPAHTASCRGPILAKIARSHFSNGFCSFNGHSSPSANPGTKPSGAGEPS
jgi:hypothetical protein